MSVLDASVWLGMVAGDVRPGQLPDEPLLVPAHFDAEVLSGLRGLVRGGHVAGEVAEAWWAALGVAPLVRVPLAELAGVWTLSAAVSAYDAPYVALAAQEDIALVTLDGRLARGAAPHCRVELVGS